MVTHREGSKIIGLLLLGCGALGRSVLAVGGGI